MPLPRHFRTGETAGRAALIASVGVQVTLASMLLIPAPERIESALTQWGRQFFFPERDVDLYVLGVLATLVAGMLLLRRGRAEAGRRPVAELALAIATLALFTARWLAVRAGPEGRWTLGAILLVTAAGFVLPGGRVGKDLPDQGGRVGKDLPDPGGRSGEDPPAPGSRIAAKSPAPEHRRLAESIPGQPAARPAGWRRLSPWDIAVPLCALAVCFVPDAASLAGGVFTREGLFHWDYYTMGPALAFSHGDALGTDAYAMYGLGWPLLFGLIARWVPLSYGTMIKAGSLFAALYFTGVYVFFRAVTRRPWLAAAGTGLALLHMFLGMGSDVVWTLPSVTVMRWGFDIWCFMSLWQLRSTGQLRWAAAAGAAAGLAILFSTDTGLYLAASAAVFWLLTLWESKGPAQAPAEPETAGTLRPAHGAVAVASALATLGAGLLVASRGSLLDGAFWRGWLEPLRDYRGGFAQAPIASVPDWVSIAGFTTLFFVYLCLALVPLARLVRRRAKRLDALTAALALYGLMNLNHFVGRSVDGSMLRLVLPLVLILVPLAGESLGRLPDRSRTAVAATAAALTLATLAVLPRSALLQPAAAYFSLLARALGSRPAEGPCLIDGVCGLPPSERAAAATVERITSVLPRGGSLAVIDETGSLFYLATGREPYFRYPRVLVNMYNRTNSEAMLRRLRTEPPDLVLLRMAGDPQDPRWRSLGPGPHSPFYADTFEQLAGEVRSSFMLVETLEPYEIWTRD